MADLTDQKQLEEWLEAQPREVCIAIAARAVLRLFSTLSHESSVWISASVAPGDVVLVIMRALVLPLCVAEYPSRDFQLRSIARAASGDAAHAAPFASIAYATDGVLDATAATTMSPADFISAVAHIDRIRTASFDRSAAAYTPAVRAAAAQDALFIINGGPP
jgi:hypothetical protein